MSLFSDWQKMLNVASNAAGDKKMWGEADSYRAALEKSAYGDAGAQYGQGLNQITNYLAKSGPLADGGAGTALRYRLASQLYGGAKSKILSGYAQYLKELQQQRRQFEYQKQLLKYHKDQQSTGIGGFLGGALGSVAGPFGAAVGTGLGEKVVG